MLMLPGFTSAEDTWLLQQNTNACHFLVHAYLWTIFGPCWRTQPHVQFGLMLDSYSSPLNMHTMFLLVMHGFVGDNCVIVEAVHIRCQEDKRHYERVFVLDLICFGGLLDAQISL